MIFLDFWSWDQLCADWGVALIKVDDPENRVPYISRAMWTEAQVKYVVEVLGTSPDFFVVGQPLAVSLIPIIYTRPMNPAERELLRNILKSIQLESYQLVESELSEGLGAVGMTPARCVLTFGFSTTSGRRELGELVVWDFPALALMLPTAPDVALNKKITWTILKQLGLELNT